MKSDVESDSIRRHCLCSFLDCVDTGICRSGGKEDEMMEQLRKKAKEQEIKILQIPQKPTIHPCDTTDCSKRDRCVMYQGIKDSIKRR